jgi:glutamine synthetase
VHQRLLDAGIDTVVGHEMEFVLVAPDGSGLPAHMWAQYGLAGILEFEGFVRDVTNSATASGVAIEQFHPEYGRNQFEISLSPQSPVAAADQLVLMRIIIGRVARQYGLRVSLSPVPFAGSVGSGAHQHFSMKRGETPLFSDGDGVAGMTAEGESAVAGLLAGLPEAQGILSGSVVSGLRMQPGLWSGAYVCWGTENREAAVRYLIGGSSNPQGANVEVKVIDPSANPYYATATILGLALDGIERELPLPPETTIDPAKLTDDQRKQAGIKLLASSQAEALEALDQSTLIRGILGDDSVDAVLAVRRYEQQNYGELRPDELADKFRLAWSV